MKFYEQMKKAYDARSTNQFLLVGNTGDLVEYNGEYKRLPNSLDAKLSCVGFKSVMHYDLARGITFLDADAEEYVASVMCPELPRGLFLHRAHPEWQKMVAESGVYSVLTLKRIRELTSKLARGNFEPVAVIIENAEMLFPQKDIGSMNDVDRQRILQLINALEDGDFRTSHHLLVLVADSASSIHDKVKSHLSMRLVEVERPDSSAREAYMRKHGIEPDSSIIEATAGMTLFALQAVINEAKHLERPLSRAEIAEHMEEMLRSELGDKISIVQPDYGMDAIVGNTKLKKVLTRVGRLIAHPDPSISPVGILVSGPNGVGKTFIFKAWAKSLGMTVIELKNLRSMYFGQTDKIFEVLRSVIEPLSNVLIMVDEADVAFAKPGDNTHETEARLFGNVIKMMGERSNRGKIVWLLMTARPQRLAPDIKRPGRCGMHIPVFDPAGEDRDSFIEFAMGDFPEVPRDSLSHISSPSDFNELRLQLRGEKLVNPGVSNDELAGIARSFLPANIGPERETQLEQAKLHCSFRELMPCQTSGAASNALNDENETDNSSGE